MITISPMSKNPCSRPLRGNILFSFLQAKAPAMFIANPIYDLIFKYLMQDLSIARRFLSLILGKNIADLQFQDREKLRIIKDRNDPEAVSSKLRFFHLDFLAEIQNENGSQKVLIELQKTHEDDDAHRFRAYIGEIYTHDKLHYEKLLKEEIVSSKQEGREPKPIHAPSILPLIPVVILGFKLEPKAPEGEDALILHIQRKGFNPNADYAPVPMAYAMAEALSHDLVLIQIPYLPKNPQTELEKVLSVFDQRFLNKDRPWIKNFPLDPENCSELLRDILKSLNLLVENPKVAEEIQAEEESYLHAINLAAEMRENERRNAEILAAKDKELVESAKALAESAKVIKDKDNALIRAAQALAEAKGIPLKEAQQLLGIK